MEQADAYRLQLENFIDVIRGQDIPRVPLVESVVNTFTLEAMVTSVLEKRIVKLDIPEVVRQAFQKTRGSL